jgi:hypothetical protein
VQGVTTSREHQAANDAADRIVFADGLEQGGFEDYAQRARVVARETIWLADELAAERSARKAIQEQRDRLLELVTQ